VLSAYPVILCAETILYIAALLWNFPSLLHTFLEPDLLTYIKTWESQLKAL